MMRTLKQLYDLQVLDIKISSLEKSRAEVREKLADNSAIISAKNEVTETDSTLQKVLSEHRSSERDATQLSEKLQEIDAKLYGGSITSPRELSAAQEEREFTFQKQREESDRLLDLMVHSEELQKSLSKSKENLVHIEANAASEKSSLSANETRLTKELMALETERNKAVSQIEPNSISIYESLRNSKTGYAVAAVEKGMCQGCRLTLSTTQLQKTRNAQKIVQCNSCHRILYLN